MTQRLYEELVPWYGLIDPADDHEAEAASYRAALERVAAPAPETLLELGAGAGNNVVHLKRRFRCTATDLSPAMLELSRARNPECEHVVGDMRTLRLGREFDAVLVHDAVVYMTTEDDLLAAARTAFVHTRPGGAAVFAPDALRDTFEETTNLLEGGDATRAFRGIEWSWVPDPAGTLCMVEYSFLLREGGTVRSVHDRHVEGLFPKATWERVLTRAGYEVGTFDRPRDDDGGVDEVFVCRRP